MKKTKDRLQRVVIVGATPSGIAAANKLGEMGIPVTLVDHDTDLDKKFSRDEWTLPSGVRLNYAHRPGLIRILRNPNIHILMPAEVTSIKHSPQGFSVRIEHHPTYINSDRCILCGRCAEVCTVSDGKGVKAVVTNGRGSLPGRPVVEKRNEPLCQVNCPLGVNVQGYMALTREGKFDDALELIRDRNVLPSICGRICTHPCESACRRGEWDDPLAIREVKRFLADHISAKKPSAPVSAMPNTNSTDQTVKKVAVIGSGPSGLAAAAELARHGCSVTVYEKENEAGGLLRYAVGSYRLPEEVLRRDIAYIESLGVIIETGRTIKLDEDLEGSLRDFDAVIAAVGTWRDRRLDVPGEDLEGVSGCLEFLNGFYRSEKPHLPKRLAVIGDGNSAFDLARTMRRLGAEVDLISWFPGDMIPADAEEIRTAREEGVRLIDSLQVTEFSGNGGKLESLRCVRTEPGAPDDRGICWPVPVDGEEPVILSYSRVFVAIGQTRDPSGTAGNVFSEIFKSESPYVIRGNPKKQGTILLGAGDAVNGPTSVVDAMASGRRTAQKLLSCFADATGDDGKPRRPVHRDFPPIDASTPRIPRVKAREVPVADRVSSFVEVNEGFDEIQVREEASRCLQCGICSQCMQCVEACGPIGAINHADTSHEITENAGIVILADQNEASRIKGDDVIRAYSSKTAKSDTYSLLARGFSAAARAMVLLGSSGSRPKGHGLSFSPPDPGLSPDIRLGVFVCRCNDSMGWTSGMDEYVKNLTSHDGVIHAETVLSACIPDGYQHILRTIREKGLTRVVLASCVCCSLNFVCSSCTDQRSRLKYALFTGTGISRSMVEMVNVRGETLRLIEKNPSLADRRFISLMESSIRRARRLKVLPTPARNYNFASAVIGETEAVRSSALTLAESGYEVYLFDTSGEKHSRLPDHQNIHIFTNAWVHSVSGTLGNFQIYYTMDGTLNTVQAGTVILGKKSSRKVEYKHQKELPGKFVSARRQRLGETGVPFIYPGATPVSGLYIADIPDVTISDREKGAAAAVLAATKMPRGPRSNRGFTVVINEALCRGCGRCAQYCPYQAVSFNRNDMGGWVAAVDDALCKGCGNCISVCPSNAADSPYRSHYFLEKVIEELLS